MRFVQMKAIKGKRLHNRIMNEYIIAQSEIQDIGKWARKRRKLRKKYFEKICIKHATAYIYMENYIKKRIRTGGEQLKLSRLCLFNNGKQFFYFFIL